MEKHPFGSTHRPVSVIGQGTWYQQGDDLASSMSTLRLGLDLGLSHIDTAEMYLSGGAEKLVGEAIAGRRDQVFLVSKVLPISSSHRGTIAACENTLRRLGTDHLDSYLLHWRGAYPLEDTVSAFERLMSEGKILSWGVSNFDEPDLKEIWKLIYKGHGRLACNQVLYHLQDRTIEHAVLPWCEKHGVAVVGFSPFGHGRFPAPASPGGQVLKKIADVHGATPRQVALCFLVRRPSLFTIPKASSREHVAENAGAGGLLLSDEELARIDEAFPLGPRPSELSML